MGSRASGLFVAVDGPKHVGKSEVLNLVAPILRAEGLSVLVTKEPTPQFNLSNEEHHAGLELARLLAADREQHLKHTIVPGLSSNDVVITDRYVGSSLAFQVLDGVPFDDVWALNAMFLRPHLNVFLTAHEATIGRRLLSRDRRTRFDRACQTAQEIAQYQTVFRFMAEQGVKVVEVPNGDDVTPHQTAMNVSRAILEQQRVADD